MFSVYIFPIKIQFFMRNWLGEFLISIDATCQQHPPWRAKRCTGNECAKALPNTPSSGVLESESGELLLCTPPDAPGIDNVEECPGVGKFPRLRALVLAPPLLPGPPFLLNASSFEPLGPGLLPEYVLKRGGFCELSFRPMVQHIWLNWNWYYSPSEQHLYWRLCVWHDLWYNDISVQRVSHFAFLVCVKEPTQTSRNKSRVRSNDLQAKTIHKKNFK